MRSHKHIIGICPGCQLLRLQYPPEVGDIGLDDVRCLQLKELAEIVARVNALACCNRNIDLLRHFLESGKIFRWDGFFYPGGFKLLQVAGNLKGCRGVEATMHLNKDLDLWANSSAHRLDQRN